MGITSNPGPYYLHVATDERQQSVIYDRDSNTGLVQKITYQDGSYATFSYHAFLNPDNSTYFYKLQQSTDQRGAQITYNYDESGHGGSGFRGLLTSVTRTYDDGTGTKTTPSESTQLYYDTSDRLSKSVDPASVTTLYAYNERNQIKTITHAVANGYGDNSHVDSTYDDYGNCTKVTDELSHIVKQTTYDAFRRPTLISTPVNDIAGNPVSTVSFSYAYYDASGNTVESATNHTAANWGLRWINSGTGVERIYTADNRRSEEYTGAAVSGSPPTPDLSGGCCLQQSFRYNAVGQLQKTIDADRQNWLQDYDNAGRRATATDPLGHVTTWTYYGNGETCANGGDATDLLKQVTAPGPASSTAPTVPTNYTRYDLLGRCREVDDALANRFKSDFDSASDLTSQTDGANATGYSYDGLGRKVAITYPGDGTTETWTYDAVGNVSKHKTRAGATCTLSQYDTRHRPVRWDWDDGTPFRLLVYDAAARLTEVHNTYSGIKLAYDDAGRLQSEQQSTRSQPWQTTTYRRDKDGNVISITYPNGNVPTYSYDPRGRCIGVTSVGVARSKYNYLPNSNRLIGRWMGNGLYTGYAYQDNGRCQELEHYLSADTVGTPASGVPPLRDYLYGFAPDGKISWFERRTIGGQTGKLENGRGDRFVYGLDGSLTEHDRDISGGWPSAWNDHDTQMQNFSTSGGSADTATKVYGYDAAGNRQSVTVNSVLSTYTFNAANESQPSGYKSHSNNWLEIAAAAG